MRFDIELDSSELRVDACLLDGRAQSVAVAPGRVSERAFHPAVHASSALVPGLEEGDPRPAIRSASGSSGPWHKDPPRGRASLAGPEPAPGRTASAQWAAAVLLALLATTPEVAMAWPPPLANGSTFQPPDPSAWELVAVGDIMMAGSGRPDFESMGYDAPFAAFATAFASADVVYGNLEGPAGTNGEPVTGKQFTFLMAPDVPAALRRAGFDVVHLANNHILDYGPPALADTLALARAAGLATCGAGWSEAEARAPAVVTTPTGLRLAFVCYSNTLPEAYYASVSRPGTAYGHATWVAADVAAAAARADVVVAAFHWGAELMTTPKDYQRELAQIALAAGASVVLGHHPHVLQPIERYSDAVVVYSLGNFVFGSFSAKVSDSAIVRIRGRGRRIEQVAALPIDVYNPRVVFQPRPLGVDSARAVAVHLFGHAVTREADGWWTADSAVTETP